MEGSFHPLVHVKEGVMMNRFTATVLRFTVHCDDREAVVKYRELIRRCACYRSALKKQTKKAIIKTSRVGGVLCGYTG